MTSLVLRGMAKRRLRTLLSAVAVLLGVAMIAGTYVQTDQISSAFVDIQRAANQGSDVVIRPREAFESGFTMPDPVDQALVGEIAAVPGVASVAAELWESASLIVDGEKVGSDVAPSALTSVLAEPFDAIEVAAGRSPAGRGEILLDTETASKSGLSPGDRVQVATRTGVRPARLVGTYVYGGGLSLGGAVVIAATLEQVQAWSDRAGKVNSIMAAADPGVTPAELRRRIDAVLPSQLEVLTSQADSDRQASQINDAIGSLLTPALLALAGAAVLVGGFIIFNTFSITVAQRTREFALLRSLGATRRQLMALVAAEAALIGVTASALGLGLGLGFSKLLGGLFDAAGFGIPRSAMELAPRTIVISLAVGIGVTLLAALAPALRATRVAPVLAMQPGAASPSRRRRLLPWASAATALAGLGVLTAGLFASGSAESRLGSMAGGVVLLFVGVALSSRYLVRPIAAVAGWPIERLSRATGRLARENAVREPGRTATTAAALMVGIGLVVFVAVFADGLKSSMRGGFDDRIRADYVVRSESLSAADPQTAAAAEQVRAVDGVRSASEQRFAQVKINRDELRVATDTANGLDVATLGDWYSIDFEQGDDSVLGRLASGPAAIVEEQFAKAHGLSRGDEFLVTSPSGRRVRLVAAGVYRDPLILQGFIVDQTMFDRIAPAADPWLVWIRADDGADALPRLKRAVSSFSGLEAQTMDAYEADAGGQLDQLVYLLYALLAMSVVISLFGIANALFLSIHERTRELGLLRALGTTREQVRRLVRYESVITAVIGGLLGIAIGLVFAFLMTAALADLGLGFSVPVAQLVVFLALAVVVGVVGAVLPARRGARIDILDALHHE